MLPKKFNRKYIFWFIMGGEGGGGGGSETDRQRQRQRDRERHRQTYKINRNAFSVSIID